MRKITLALATVAVAGSLMAQDSGFSVGLDFAIPMGNTADLYSFGLGPVVSYEKEAGSQGLLGLSVAYTIMFPKEDFVKSGAIIPIQAGYKYFFDDIREGIYIGAMVGYGIQTVKTKDMNFGPITVEGESSSNAGFALAPVVGYVVNERLDLGLRYQLIMTSDSNDGSINSNSSSTSFPYIGLRAAYNF